MAEFTIGEVSYRTTKLNARQQWNIARRIAPLLSGAGDLLKALDAGAPASDVDYFAAFGPLANALAGLSDEASDYVLNTCMRATTRLAGEQWRPVMTPDGTLMWQDVDMKVMLVIAWNVLQESLGGFLSDLPGNTRAKLAP